MTTTPTTPRKRNRIWTPTDRSLVPEGATVPAPIAEPSAKARAAWDAWQQAIREVNEAGEAAKAAPGVDAEADRRALAAGKKDMPKRTEPAKRAALADATRRRTAAEQIVRDALFDQAEAITDAHADWLETQAAAVGERVARVRALVDELRAVFAALRIEQTVLDSLQKFDGSPQSWMINPPLRPDKAAARQARAENDVAQAARLGTGQLTTRDVEHLTAALVALAEDAAKAA